MTGVTLGININSLRAQRHLDNANATLARTNQALASGMRINRASDDAAGLAIASTLNTNARIYGQAIRNINDGVSALSIAQGTLGEFSNMLIRMKDLSSQAASGTFSRTQRSALNTESTELRNEFNRLLSTSTFNGINLIENPDGTMTLQVGTGSAASSRITINLGGNLSRNQGTSYGNAIAFDDGGVSGQTLSGDFNGDGIADAVTLGAGGLNAAFSVAFGNGDGTFSTTVTIDSGLSSFSAGAVGDINGDGSLDVVGTSSTGYAVFLGNGDGTFRSEVTSGATGFSHYVALGDFNGDGILDMAGSTTLTNNITVHYLSATGSLSGSATLANGAGVRQFGVGDMNGDGYADIVSGSTSGSVAVGTFFSNGASRTFQSRITTAGFVANATRIAVGDFNYDGFMDVVASAGGTSVTVGFGNGSGTFSGLTNHTISAASTRLVVGDFDSDGIVDIGSNTASTFNVLRGDSRGAFATAEQWGGVGVGSFDDFNGDGVVDFLTTAGLRLVNTTRTNTLKWFNLSTQSDARATLSLLDNALKRVSLELGQIGSMQSRLEVALNSVRSARDEGLTAADRISSADIAAESATMTRTRILQEVGAAILAQANQGPQIALQLLRA